MSGRNKADSRAMIQGVQHLRGVSVDVTRDQAPADLSPKILIRYYGQVRRAALRSYTPPISAQLPAAVCSCVVLNTY